MKSTPCMILVMTWLPAAAGLRANQEAAPKVWLSHLNEGMTQARQSRRPILVDAGAVWCGWCRKLDVEFSRAEVQKELERWTLVRIDIDQSPEDARTLGVGPVPALRILAPSGQTVASHDGYMPAEELVQWLTSQYDAAAALAVATEALIDAAPPDEASLEKVIQVFRHRDAVMRETAIRRLLPHPAVCAVRIVRAFTEGDLATRLAAFELLHDWQAPIGGIDPWRPDSFKPDSLAALRVWALSPPAEEPADAADAEGAGTESPGTALSATELRAFLSADSLVEVAAMGARLARRGAGVLPAVYEALRLAQTDRDRERLTFLRYRVVATDKRVLEWPGGLERLAATQVRTRHQAAEELSARAAPDDAPLLLELFSDPDGLVREVSLRTLRQVGGGRTDEALVKLLHDPEPNVRAAVLKQLEDDLSAALVGKITEYVAWETDPDLVVHAARALRNSETPAALKALLDLLAHESWRVRAEAAEAIGQRLDRFYDDSDDRKADLYVALIKLLDDPDGFVVGRAIGGLEDVDLIAAVEPLTRAALAHPELAPEALDRLARPALRSKALPVLKDFCTHEEPAIRAAAIGALCESAPDDAGAELLRTLQDEALSVRIAAAQALFTLLPQLPAGGTASAAASGLFNAVRDLFGTSSDSASKPSKSDLTRLRDAASRPAWIKDAAAPLQRLLREEAPQARIAAARPLAALGLDDEALPILLVTARATPTLAADAPAVLPWLPDEQRRETFEALVGMKAGAEVLVRIADALDDVESDDAEQMLWRLVGLDDADDNLAGQVARSLMARLIGDDYYNSNLSAARKREVVQAAQPRAREGPELQRVVALALLATADDQAAVAQARAILDDADLPGRLRADGLQVLLMCQDKREAEPLAVQCMASPAAELRRTALMYLTEGSAQLGGLREHRIWIPRVNRTTEYSASDRGSVPQAPPGLTPEVLRPLSADSDAATAARAAYLLVLLGEREPLERLLSYWREHARDDHAWRKMAYGAVASLGDDTLTPVLEEIYESFEEEDYAVREFYWTIRGLRGERILKLRKRIRDEVGMDSLQ